MRHSEGQGRFNPVTFADVYYDEENKEHPIEPELIGDEDSCSKQALDYIFWLLPNKRPDVPQILNSVPNNSIPITHFEQNVDPNALSQAKMRVAVEKTKLEKLPVAPGHIFSFCSDHFGISTVIERNLP